MGGSGGGGTYKMTAREVEKLREEAMARLERQRLDAEVNSLIQRELVELNDRDTEQISRRLDEIEDALREESEGLDRLLFGGSVAKHTYVNGLSDVDSLVVLDPDVVGDRNPHEVRQEFRRILEGRLDMGQVQRIDVGNMAVTVTYRDGAEIQLLPAVAQGDSHAISSADGREWVQIDPRRFSRRLSELNEELGGGVVPTIKLAKAVVASQIPKDHRPSGYHIEALATAAFDGYTGARTPRAMVEHFFQAAQDLVRQPVADITRQSRHVDESLGPAESEKRASLARRLERVARRMRTATSAADWEALWRE